MIRPNKPCNPRKYSKYDQVFKWALEHWNDMLPLATRDYHNDNPISIADQIEMYTDCPNTVATEIARSISLSKSLM